MNNCPDLFILSTIAYKLSECFNEEELSILSASFSVLGDMLEVIIAKLSISENN